MSINSRIGILYISLIYQALRLQNSLLCWKYILFLCSLTFKHTFQLSKFLDTKFPIFLNAFVVEKDLIGITRKNQYALLNSASPQIPVLMHLLSFIHSELRKYLKRPLLPRWNWPNDSILPKVMA